jgi:hypothetical protein
VYSLYISSEFRKNMEKLFLFSASPKLGSEIPSLYPTGMAGTALSL